MKCSRIRVADKAFIVYLFILLYFLVWGQFLNASSVRSTSRLNATKTHQYLSPGVKCLPIPYRHLYSQNIESDNAGEGSILSSILQSRNYKISLYSLTWDIHLSQINIWTTTTWSNVWIVLPKPSWYEFLIGFMIWTPASKYCVLQPGLSIVSWRRLFPA